MLGLDSYQHFFKTQKGIAFVINHVNGKDICIHVSKSGLGFQYAIGEYDENGHCAELGGEYQFTGVTTIKEAGFEVWHKACLKAKHPLDRRYNTQIISSQDHQGTVRFICCPCPRDADDRNTFAMHDYNNDLPYLVDIRDFKFYKIRNVIRDTAFSFAGSYLLDDADDADDAIIEDTKAKLIAMKSAVFHYTETNDPEKFVLYNLETEEAFIINKDELNEYIEICYK